MQGVGVGWSKMSREGEGQLTLSPQYLMVTCLTHGDSVGGRGGEGVKFDAGGGVSEAKYLTREGGVRRFHFTFDFLLANQVRISVIKFYAVIFPLMTKSISRINTLVRQ